MTGVQPTRARRWLMAAILVACSGACGSGPATPDRGPLPEGRWIASAVTGVCLSVASTGCDLVAGCGHGQFPQPVVGTDNTFAVDGTYRIEAGPVSINPGPPAHFSGSVTGSQITVTVVPTGSLPPATYVLSPASGGRCAVPCL